MGKKRGKKLKNVEQATNQPNASMSIVNGSTKKKRARRRKATTITIGSLSTSTSSLIVQPPVVAQHKLGVTPAHTEAASEAKTKEKGNEVGFSGFIFMCNAKTKAECYRYRVFGLPAMRKEEVQKIKLGLKLFLYDFELKLLYGIYKATSGGELDLEPNAFSGRFPAQVRFEIFKECLPLRESAFKNAILNNYEGHSKFKPELTRKQVKSLVSLFHDINEPLPGVIAPPQPTALPTLVPNVAPPYHHPFPLPTAHAPPLHDGLPYHHSYQYPIVNGPERPAHPQDHAYLSGLHQTQYQPPSNPQSVQIVPPSVYDRYEAAGRTAHVQLHVEPQHVVQPHAFPPADWHAVQPHPYYLGGVHQPYVPENPAHTTENLYRRYGVVAPEALKNRYIGYESEYLMPQVPSERGTVHQSDPVVDYYNQYLPLVTATHPPPVTAAHAAPITASQTPIQEQSVVPPHVSLPPSRTPRELPLYYPPHYYIVPAYGDPNHVYADPHQAPVSGRGSLSVETVPASSLYAFAGAAPAYR